MSHSGSGHNIDWEQFRLLAKAQAYVLDFFVLYDTKLHS